MKPEKDWLVMDKFPFKMTRVTVDSKYMQQNLERYLREQTDIKVYTKSQIMDWINEMMRERDIQEYTSKSIREHKMKILIQSAIISAYHQGYWENRNEE